MSVNFQKNMEIGIDCESHDRKRTTNWMRLSAVKKKTASISKQRSATAEENGTVLRR